MIVFCYFGPWIRVIHPCRLKQLATQLLTVNFNVKTKLANKCKGLFCILLWVKDHFDNEVQSQRIKMVVFPSLFFLLITKFVQAI